ncbi:HAMP domain-containing histidine kinase [Paenibacillus sp. S3N08]|uniref:HAMP domain-containing histidine kinase n=1 Tax=Paenibacillus agricola TaxID=2716264 RepID=A0ABX0JBZ0_9BACL|nr:HAMP domain-containing histidine kinase [Paenibacillus agricola]
MIKLVNDLLDMARIEAGQLEVRPVNCNLSELVRLAMARMEAEFVKKQVNVELISEEAQDIHVFADPDRIDQVYILDSRIYITRIEQKSSNTKGFLWIKTFKLIVMYFYS